jgi:hypothetical protein
MHVMLTNAGASMLAVLQARSVSKLLAVAVYVVIVGGFSTAIKGKSSAAADHCQVQAQDSTAQHSTARAATDGSACAGFCADETP